MDRIGELAAFATSLCWTFSALWFEKATIRIGALFVNLFKVLIAFVLLAVTAWLLRGMPLPLDAPPTAWLYLSLSGLVGFVIADIFLFRAYALIGSRFTVLFLPLSPPLTALGSLILTGETMSPAGMAGMALVVAGILVVALEKKLVSQGAKAPALAGQPASSQPSKADRTKGILFAFLSAVGQAGGVILTKLGIGSYDAVSATQIRIIAAILGFTALVLVMGKAKAAALALRDMPAMRFTTAGALVGPFIGVVLSLVAIQRTGAGAASTLMSLMPVLILPVSAIMEKQKVRLIEVLGACLAVGGTALFFFA